jgi:hypothetical protein
MNIEKAMQRIIWRLSNGTYTPNQNDVEAVTFLAEWINREKEKTIKENYIFAKLYVNQFIQEIEFYRDIKFAQRNLNEMLQKPIISFYENFHDRLNFLELMKYSKKIGLNEKHPAFLNIEEIDADRQILKENEKTYIEYANGIWNYQTVEKSLNNQITEAINRYKNLN